MLVRCYKLFLFHTLVFLRFFPSRNFIRASPIKFLFGDLAIFVVNVRTLNLTSFRWFMNFSNSFQSYFFFRYTTCPFLRCDVKNVLPSSYSPVSFLFLAFTLSLFHLFSSKESFFSLFDLDVIYVTVFTSISLCFERHVHLQKNNTRIFPLFFLSPSAFQLLTTIKSHTECPSLSRQLL